MTDWTRWPFFDDEHRALETEVREWAQKNLCHAHGSDVDAECRTIVVMLGRAGFLEHTVAHNGDLPDVRRLAVIRAALAYQAGLADFSFAMQGLGSGAISLFGNDTIKKIWLPRVGKGEAIAAFALTEPETGSDAAAIATSYETVRKLSRAHAKRTVLVGNPARIECVRIGAEPFPARENADPWGIF